MKRIIKLFIPPILIYAFNKIKGKRHAEETVTERIKKRLKYNNEGTQDTAIYWDEDFIKILDTWGEDSAWLEIQLLLANCYGKTLDIACGSAPVMEICREFKNIKLYGCDISDSLLDRAHKKRNISKERLMVIDATKMAYNDDEFNFSYSIGSLEHFTEEGINQFISECFRVTKFGSFHFVPTNEEGKDEGWISPLQSYYNNSIEWWLIHFKKKYNKVIFVKSTWHDSGTSLGHWFLCYKNFPE